MGMVLSHTHFVQLFHFKDHRIINPPLKFIKLGKGASAHRGYSGYKTNFRQKLKKSSELFLCLASCSVFLRSIWLPPTISSLNYI